MKYKKIPFKEYKPSLISKTKTCFFCGRTTQLEVHHIYSGAFRNKSSYWGCWCYLCKEHHTGVNGVHNNGRMMNNLRALCQREFEKEYPHESFLKIFGRNYYEE